MSSPELSVVIPFYNEQMNVPILYERLQAVLENLQKSYEIIFVDDGSTDGTAQELKQVFEKDPQIKVIRLRRNFGQTAALAAGIDLAQGEFIITLDGDLQHAPEEIPRLLEKAYQGYDIVSGWREKRTDNLLTRRIPSWVANRLMAILSGVKLRDFGTTFKVYRKEVIKEIELYGEMHRFIPALASWMGVSICEVPISNPQRAHGKSNYSLKRIINVLFDLITVKFLISYVGRPLQFFGVLGGIFFTIGFIIALAITIKFFASGSLGYGNVMFAAMMMIMGVQFVAIGLTGEMSTRIYHRTSNRKIYAVKETLMHEEEGIREGE